MTARAALSPDGRLVRLAWADGRAAELGARWLFDHAREARDPVSGQRLQGLLEAGPRVLAVDCEGDLLRMLFAGSEHWRSVSLDDARPGQRAPSHTPWLRPAAILSAEPVAFNDFLADDGALLQALSRVTRFGLVLLDGAGRVPGSVERAVARFGFIRETNYGRIFDVRIEPSPSNLAFSGRGLELHTDNPYRDPPPTLQLLHALVADPAGGETLFVDGFAQAEALRTEAPEEFDLLARTPVRFSYTDASGARLSARAPVIDLAADGEIKAIRLNHRSLDLEPGGAEVERWYEAYLRFHRCVHAPDAAFERTLGPGEMVIFDNLRILHGRRPLTGGSPRWLQGCYADRDGLQATLARLEA